MFCAFGEVSTCPAKINLSGIGLAPVTQGIAGWKSDK